ncbi:hypothetical protein [Streptomyces sp. NPDC085596]|uniref:hypothetical protein n=1 Tax=Streptomyces sp. NPDC085596 TaxID=3365731 RepID=UPI0037CD977E
MPSDKTTVQPYAPGTQWTFTTRGTSYTQTQELALLAQPYGSNITAEYEPAEATATDVWQRWVTEHADREHQRRPDLYRPGQVPIMWSVTTRTGSIIMEFAVGSQTRARSCRSPGRGRGSRIDPGSGEKDGQSGDCGGEGENSSDRDGGAEEGGGVGGGRRGGPVCPRRRRPAVPGRADSSVSSSLVRLLAAERTRPAPTGSRPITPQHAIPGPRCNRLPDNFNSA